MTEPALADCHICGHAWPAQRFCSACGPRCVACLHNLLHVYSHLEVAAQAVVDRHHAAFVVAVGPLHAAITSLAQALAVLAPDAAPGAGGTDAQLP